MRTEEDDFPIRVRDNDPIVNVVKNRFVEASLFFKGF